MTRRAWYRTYFSEPYGTIYADYLLPPEMTREDVRFVCGVLGLLPADAVLDCPCGFGRHMAELRSRCHRVVGLDLGRDCLARAMDWVPGSLFVRGDMRALPFAEGEFDAVINLFNSFGYFSQKDNLRSLREFARVLKPGGRLLIETANPGVLAETVEEHPRTRQEVFDLSLTEEWGYSPETRILTNHAVIRLAGRSIRRSYRIRLYTLAEFEVMFADAALQLEAAYGETNGEPYDEETSGRLIVVGRRETRPPRRD
jgi:SAM-dependent methyltransferase